MVSFCGLPSIASSLTVPSIIPGVGVGVAGVGVGVAGVGVGVAGVGVGLGEVDRPCYDRDRYPHPP